MMAAALVLSKLSWSIALLSWGLGAKDWAAGIGSTERSVALMLATILAIVKAVYCVG